MAKHTPSVCLTCGHPVPAPKRADITRDHYGRPLVFCKEYCFTRFMAKQPKA